MSLLPAPLEYVSSFAWPCFPLVLCWTACAWLAAFARALSSQVTVLFSHGNAEGEGVNHRWRDWGVFLAGCMDSK